MKTIQGYEVEILKVVTGANDKATLRVNYSIDEFTAYEIACELLESDDIRIFDLECENDITTFGTVGNFNTNNLI